MSTLIEPVRTGVLASKSLLPKSLVKTLSCEIVSEDLDFKSLGEHACSLKDNNDDCFLKDNLFWRCVARLFVSFGVASPDYFSLLALPDSFPFSLLEEGGGMPLCSLIKEPR